MPTSERARRPIYAVTRDAETEALVERARALWPDVPYAALFRAALRERIAAAEAVKPKRAAKGGER